MIRHNINLSDNYVIMADIHGNYEALQTAVNKALQDYGKSIKGFIFLGDYAGDFPFGKQVLDLIMELKKSYEVFAIAGNRETGMAKTFYNAVKDHYKNGTIGLYEAEKLTNWSLSTSMGAPLIDFCKLTKEQMEFLISLPEEMVLENSKQTFLLKHIMPLTEEEIKFLEEEANKQTEFGTKKQAIVLSAHTHEMNTGLFNDGKIHFFNPGSIGLTDSGVRGTNYGILNHDKLINNKIDYDYQKAIDDLRENELLYSNCEHWGVLLEYSIENGVNAAALYSYEKNRIKDTIKNLPIVTIQNLFSLDKEEMKRSIKSIVPILSKEDKPFATCLTSNFNPYGGYVTTTTYVTSITDNGEYIVSPVVEDIENHIVSNNNHKPINTNLEFPNEVLEVINEISFEYLQIYCKEYVNEAYVRETRMKVG